MIACDHCGEKHLDENRVYYTRERNGLVSLCPECAGEINPGGIETQHLEPGDPGAAQILFAQQKKAALNAFSMVETAVFFLGAHYEGLEVDEDLCHEGRVLAQKQRKHTQAYLRLPIRPGWTDEINAFGSKLDRLYLTVVDVLESSIDLYELPHKLKVRRELKQRAEMRRHERLKRRQAERSQAVEMAPPPVPAPKREKHEVAPRCAKCGKRPRVSGTLCEPCARWLGSGR